MKSSVTLFIAGAVLQPAAATFRDWSRAPSFSCPTNTDNKCNDQEKTGWDFGSLQVGSFNSYSSFSFEGFSCKDSKSKRDILRKRGGRFEGKAISGKASKSSGPSFSCGNSGDNRFSIEKYYVSTGRNADVEFHYSMPDGSKCSHVTSCQSSGTVVENRQCGGATSVSIQLPKHEDEDCDIDVHGIDFDCSPPQQPPTNKPPPEQPPPKQSETSPKPSGVPPKQSETPPKPSGIPPKQSEDSPKPSGMPPKQSEVPPKQSEVPPKQSEVPPKQSEVPPKQSEVPPKQSEAPPKESEAPPAPSPKPPKPSSEGPGSPPGELPSYSFGLPSASEKPSVPGSIPSSKPVPGPESSNVVGPIASSKPVPSNGGPSPPAPTGSCPDVLPKCLSTWTFSSSCKGNTDQDCFCKDEKLIATVYECLSAWGQADDEIQAAITYLIGICGEYIPSNPGIITNCPSSITIQPTSPPAATNVPQQPITVITVSETVSVPCTYTEGSSKGQTIPSSYTQSTIQTVVTVPQVAFTTGASGVALVPGPSATATGAYPAGTTLKTGRPTSSATASAVPEQFLGAAPRVVGSWVAGPVAVLVGFLFSL